MTIAETTYTEVDGQLGAVDSSTLPIAIAGLAADGAFTPMLITRPSDLLAEYVAGDLVEAAMVALKDWNLPVLVCRIDAADVGEVSLVTTGWSGTSVPSSDSGNAPIETNEYWINIVTGATVGVAGGEYKVSLDGGRTYGAVTALGTASSITLDAEEVGTVEINLAAGTIVAGSTLVIRTTAPVPVAAEVTEAVDQLGQQAYDWDCLEVSSPIDPTIAAALDTSLATMSGRVQERYWQANMRLPTVGESISAYRTAMASAWSSYSTLRGHVWPADCWFVSRVNGRKCRRPRVWATAPYVERLPLQVDPAKPSNGIVPGVTLSADDGNPQFHDEKLHGGYDNLRFCSLYQRGTSGVYVGNCRTKSPQGSDYRYVQIRRVINRGKRVLETYLSQVLSADVIVSKKTGKPTPSYVRLLKLGAEATVRSVYGVGPMVSDFDVTPDGNTNILSTEEFPFEFGVTPLGYVKRIPVKVIMRNPALRAAG